MMEMGHPSHAFDLACIPEGHLKIRWAEDGELLTTLDGVKRTLSTRNGVVAGPREALALAGVMGGASSEVSESTETVALEAAYWEPLAIRRGAKALAMHTEASHRFERGADPEGPVISIGRFAHLLLELGVGSVRPGLIDQYVAPQPVRSARLRTAKLWQLLGSEIPAQRAREILEGLGFQAVRTEAEGAEFQVPSWRGDVSREADLIEEVVRHHGIDKIPSTLPPATAPGGLRPSQRIERELRGLLVAAGLTEVVNYAFVSDETAQPQDASQVRLENPLSQEQGALRVSLVRPGLLESLLTNLRQGRRDVRLFEIGRTFAAADGLPHEERRLGLVLHGPVHAAHWSEKPRCVDLFDASGLLEALGRRLGATLRRTAEGVPGFLHPGKSAVILRDDVAVGYVGSLHPELAQQLELREETVVGELRLDPLLEEPRRPTRFRPFARFPAVTRDLSILCDASVAAESLESRVREAAGERLSALVFVDRYDRPPVPAGKVSLTITLRFQDPGRTLTGEEVQESMDRVVRALEQMGTEIRGV
jgi:phenylalanyl-tRNA synthetase beta chain